MMTLLPVAAFAGEASISASVISADASSKPANYNTEKNYSTVKVKVAVRDGSNKYTTNLGGNRLFIWAERSDEVVSDVDKIVSVSDSVYSYNQDTTKSWIEVESLTNGIVEVKYASGIAGNVVFKAAIAPAEYDIEKVAETSKYHIGSVNFEWKQLGAKEIKLVKVNDKDIVVDEGKDVNKSDNWENVVLKADGKEVKLTFELLDGNVNPLTGEKVKFSLNKSGAQLNKTEATTDVLGQVDVKVYAYEADDYRLTVEHGSKVLVVELNFGASSDAFEIALNDTVKDKIAIGYSPTIEFKLFDVFGNRIYGKTLLDIDLEEDDYEVEFIKKPSASDLEDDDLSLVVNDTNPDKADLIKVDFAQDVDVAGTYEVKVTLPNGKFATATFEAAEQGKITRMVLDLKESYLAYGSKSSEMKVKYYDDNNVYYEDKTLSSIELSVSNTALAKIDGKRVVAREAKYNDFSSGKVVITAIDTARGLVATDEVVIGSLVAGLEVATPEDVLVNESAKITYQLVNQNGDPIAFDAINKTDIDVDAYVISAPEGANVDINLPLKSEYQNSLSRTGKVDVEVESEVPGNVVIAFVVTGPVSYEDGKKETITLSNTAEIKFVAEKVALGAKSVTLFIGSTNYVVDGQPKVSDLAPFIQDNRTFVPVRVVGEALGAEVEWDAATQTVTIAREDLTATLTIGSNEITLSDGTVVVSDVAPFIKDGRTVLPFRVIGEIFGADVEAVSAADGRTIAVTFEQ